jgi:hypothetical protein
VCSSDKVGKCLSCPVTQESSVRQPVKVKLEHFLGEKMESKTLTITALVNSLEAFLILVV